MQKQVIILGEIASPVADECLLSTQGPCGYRLCTRRPAGTLKARSEGGELPTRILVPTIAPCLQPSLRGRLESWSGFQRLHAHDLLIEGRAIYYSRSKISWPTCSVMRVAFRSLTLCSAYKRSSLTSLATKGLPLSHGTGVLPAWVAHAA